MKQKKSVILINPIKTGYQYIQVAEHLGFTPLVVFALPLHYLEHDSQVKNLITHQNHVLYSFSTDEIIKYTITHQLDICGVVPCSEPGVILANTLAMLLKLAHNNIANIDAARDKFLMRQLLDSHGLNRINFSKCQDMKGVEAFLSKTTYPIVVKTPSGAGTDKVFLCNNDKQVVQKLDSILNTTDLFGNKAPYALLEEYIQGEEYVVDVFSDGVNFCVTDVWKYLKYSNNCASFLYKKAILLNRDYFSNNVYTYLFSTLKKIGFIKGTFHIELKVDNDEVYIIEIGARLPGICIPTAVNAISLFNLHEENLRVFTNKNYQIDFSCDYNSHCQIVLCSSLSSGTVTSVKGLREITKLDSYVYYEANFFVGKDVTVTKNLQNILLTVVLVGDSQEQVSKDAELVDILFQPKIENVDVKNKCHIL